MANYPQEFKDRIVDLHRQGNSFNDLAREFNLSATSISNWVRAADRHDGARAKDEEADEESDKARIRRLERQLAAKEEELEILGKALAFFARRMDP